MEIEERYGTQEVKQDSRQLSENRESHLTRRNEAVTERVRDVLSKIARLPETEAGFPPDADLFRDLCVDSAAALDILLSLEDEFGVAIPDDSFGNARSLRSIAKLVAGLELRK
jgi:acyl carrier protein